MTYDDCLYCSTCGWHHEECWCRTGVLRDEDEQMCHRPNPYEGSIGLGRAEQPCTQAPDRAVTSFAKGGIVRGLATAGDDRIPFLVSRCMFDGVARVIALPGDSGGAIS